MMFNDLPDGFWYGDQNTWNTIPVSRKKITLSKWIIEQKQTEQNRTETNENQITDEQQQKTDKENE